VCRMSGGSLTERKELRRQIKRLDTRSDKVAADLLTNLERLFPQMRTAAIRAQIVGIEAQLSTPPYTGSRAAPTSPKAKAAQTARLKASSKAKPGRQPLRTEARRESVDLFHQAKEAQLVEILEAVSRLPVQLREAVQLYLIERKTLAVCSKRLRTSVATTQRRVKAGLEQLAKLTDLQPVHSLDELMKQREKVLSAGCSVANREQHHLGLNINAETIIQGRTTTYLN
jgi:hypothetical protein